MAKFFGSYLERKPVDRTVLRWLTQLPDDFYVFVELQGGDFQVDFLVLKPTGIFNIEAKNWQVRRAHLDSDWELADGRQLHSPVIQAREQCDRVANYLLLQRDRFMSRDLADVFLDKKNDFKIFPIVAISHPRPPASVPSHPYFKIFVDADHLKKHLERFSWEVDTPAIQGVLTAAMDPLNKAPSITVSADQNQTMGGVEIDRFMQAAIAQARKSRSEGGIPIGSALARGGELIAGGFAEAVPKIAHRAKTKPGARRDGNDFSRSSTFRCRDLSRSSQIDSTLECRATP